MRIFGYTRELRNVVFHLREWQLGEDWARYLFSRPFNFFAMATSRPKKSYLSIEEVFYYLDSEAFILT